MNMLSVVVAAETWDMPGRSLGKEVIGFVDISS